MRRALAALALGAAVVVGMPLPAAAAEPVSIELDQAELTTSVGARFSLVSTVRNDGGQNLTGVIAHIDVVSIDPDVYVDPEDWSSERTQYIGRIAAHASVRLTWNLHAVNSGPLLVYVAVATETGDRAVVAGEPLRLSVTRQRTLQGSGIVPIAVAMPAGILVLMGLQLRRRRRLLG